MPLDALAVTVWLGLSVVAALGVSALIGQRERQKIGARSPEHEYRALAEQR